MDDSQSRGRQKERKGEKDGERLKEGKRERERERELSDLGDIDHLQDKRGCHH